MADIVVPALGESITEATVATIFKKKGEGVKMDEPIAELETDKVTVEVNATAEGVIENLNIAEGDTVEVGAIIAVVTEGAVASSSGDQAEENPSENKTANTPAPQASGGNGSSDVASPAAGKILTEKGIATADVQGSGKDGRVTKGDALNANKASSQPLVVDENRVERVKMTKLRRTIAQRLKESQNTAAILTTYNEVDMSATMALRKKYQENFVDKHGVKLGFMSFFTKACCAALKQIPAVNASIDGQEIVYHNYVNMGIAVGTKSGLVVPTVNNADKMTLSEIEKNIIELAGKARDGKLAMKDLQGGTFTITNGGVYGSLLSSPIINPPQTGILGLHKIEKRPVVVKDQIVIRPMMYIALSYDHRLIDGGEAVTFLVKVKEAIEDPTRLLLGV